jgi:hypothetical protein
VGNRFNLSREKQSDEGEKIYARLRMFERIHKRTGIHVTPKDLRDYFGT